MKLVDLNYIDIEKELVQDSLMKTFAEILQAREQIVFS